MSQGLLNSKYNTAYAQKWDIKWPSSKERNLLQNNTLENILVLNMKKNKNVKLSIAIIIIVASIIFGIYAGGWLLFLKPILAACNLFDAGMLTGIIIFKTIVKCILAPIVFSIIYSIGYVISTIIISI